MQFSGNENAKIVHSAADLIYPAPFPWLVKRTSLNFIFIQFIKILFTEKTNTKLIVAIIVPVGLVVMVGVAVGAFFIHRQRYFFFFYI
jgi:hypothetical protein